MPRKEFYPNRAMKIFLYIMSLSILAVSVLSWSIPIALVLNDPVTNNIILWVHVITVLIGILLIIWVPKYYNSITYAIDKEWLYAEGGVIWKRRSRLPVSRVQMVDLNQGPWQRMYGLASLRVFTAATGQPTAELTFQNIRDAESLRDHILKLVQEYCVDESGLGESTKDRTTAHINRERTVEVFDHLLTEVRKIRRKLEG
ncbi:MAG: PH domain-containing protein [Firmicutes bacterium]|jgi:membrane protein YdbS with pleckstrin-like domain|nr:PH domain-containing protein [Bacillota bacterium]